MVELGVNIDHVATVRQARQGLEPDPLWAAVEAQLAGANSITMHLREDRRHVQDDDLRRVRAACHARLNMEMAATDEMVVIACELKPHMVTLVPEGRQEITTEGGLDVVGQRDRMTDIVATLKASAVAVSAFIDADEAQVIAAAEVGFDICEIHTGPYAEILDAAGYRLDAPEASAALARVIAAGRKTVDAGMRFNAGHALNYLNVQPIASLPAMGELHIGHAIVSRSIFVGLAAAVREMRALINAAAA